MPNAAGDHRPGNGQRPGNSPQTPLVGEPASQVPPHPFLELLPLPRKPPDVSPALEPLRPLDILPFNLYPNPISAALFTRQALHFSNAVYTLFKYEPKHACYSLLTLSCTTFSVASQALMMS